MARILVIHGDRGARRFLVGRAELHHEAKGVDSLARAIKALVTQRPDLVIAELDGRKSEAFELLRHVKRNGIDLPVILCGAAGTGVLQPLAMKHGAAAFVEFPMEQEALDQAISKALQKDKDEHGDLPPLSSEELGTNLTELEKHLNRRMECFGGKNQVYLQSLILGNGQTTKPRIALKCSLRKRYDHPPTVYYEYIRDVCCGDPSTCPAFQEFKARNTA